MEAPITRCKFTCQSVTKSQHWDKKKGYLYAAKFSAVNDSSPENKKFYDASPCGSFEVSTYVEDLFEVGKDYYFDISPVPELAEAAK